MDYSGIVVCPKCQHTVHVSAAKKFGGYNEFHPSIQQCVSCKQWLLITGHADITWSAQTIDKPELKEDERDE